VTAVDAGRQVLGDFVVDPRFCGPPRSGNGGYVAGRLATYVATTAEPPDVEVTLRSPPPLRVRLEVSDAGTGGVVLRNGETLVAEAKPARIDLPPPSTVPFGDAVAAAERYLGRDNHPFPTCFVCGLDRANGDGLRLEPGRTGEGTVAAAWRPHTSLVDADGRVRREFVWAALDCPSGWATDLGGRPMVLGRITTRVLSLPHPDEPCVIVGLVRSVDGRKAFTASALYDGNATLLAHAESTWLEVDPAAVRPPNHST
jgi:hypothetical protein